MDKIIPAVDHYSTFGGLYLATPLSPPVYGGIYGGYLKFQNMNISHENRFLLYCLQASISGDTGDKIKDVINLLLNWEVVLESAFWHGIAPLVYNTLKDIQKSHLIPREIMAQLRTAYHGNLARNMYLYTELKRILETFFDKQAVRECSISVSSLSHKK